MATESPVLRIEGRSTSLRKERPARQCFSSFAIRMLASIALEPGAHIVSDGLACFAAVTQTVDFYKKVVSEFGGEAKTQEFAKMLMVPGMATASAARVQTGSTRRRSADCGRRQPTPSTTYLPLSPIGSRTASRRRKSSRPKTKYVGNDASKGSEMQRPLCSYPQRAWYKGDAAADLGADVSRARSPRPGPARSSSHDRSAITANSLATALTSCGDAEGDQASGRSCPSGGPNVRCSFASDDGHRHLLGR